MEKGWGKPPIVSGSQQPNQLHEKGFETNLKGTTKFRHLVQTYLGLPQLRGLKRQNAQGKTTKVPIPLMKKFNGWGGFKNQPMPRIPNIPKFAKFRIPLGPWSLTFLSEKAPWLRGRLPYRGISGPED